MYEVNGSMKKNKKYNLNKSKTVKILILVLALSFVVIPLISLVYNLVQIFSQSLF